MFSFRFSLGFVLMWIACVASAQNTPNAGSVARDAQQNTAMVTPSSGLNHANMSNDSTLTSSQDNTPIAVKSVRIIGASSLPAQQLSKLVADAVGKQLTLNELRLLAQRITHEYQRAGYPLSVAFLPAQKITDGIVTIEVIEGRITATKLNNQSRLTDDVVQQYLAHAYDEQGVLRQDRAERAMLLLKDLSGTDYVGYRLAAGEKRGDSVLNVNLGNAPLVNGSITEDNYGSKSTGEWRTRATVYLNSPFKRGEQFSLQAMSSFKGVNHARLGWNVPIGSDGLTWRGGLSHTEYELGGAFKDLNATGSSNAAEMGLAYPLIRSERRNVSVSGDVEYRRLRDEIGATSTVTDKDMTVGRLQLSASQRDDLAMGGLTQITLSPTVGNLDIRSESSRAIDEASAKANGQFYKFNLGLQRQQYFTQRFSMNASWNWQWASKNLDSSEQLTLGGVNGVTAYHSNDASVDKGWTAKLEARYAVSPYLTVAAFYDWAQGRANVNPYRLGVENHIRLNGGGLGLYANYRGFDLQAQVAWAKEKYTDQRQPRVWVQAGYRF